MEHIGGALQGRRERERENDTCAYYSFFPRKANCTRRPERAIKFHRKRKTLRGTTGRYRFFAIIHTYAGYTQGGKSTRIAVLSKRRGEKFFTAAKQGGIDGSENISVPLFAVTHPVYVPGITHVYIGHRYVDQHAAVHNVI